MSALEETLFDEIRDLDEAHKLQVLDFVHRLKTPQKSWEEWLKLADALHDGLVAQYGLNEIREERLDDIMGDTSV